MQQGIAGDEGGQVGVAGLLVDGDVCACAMQQPRHGEGEKGEHFFRSTLVQTLFYGVFSAWVQWSKDQTPGSLTRFDWHAAGWSLEPDAAPVERRATKKALKDAMRTAKSKGLSPTSALMRHADLTDLDDPGLSYPVITGEYSATPRWERRPVVPGTPVAKPAPVFTKLDVSVVEEELARLLRAGISSDSEAPEAPGWPP